VVVQICYRFRLLHSDAGPDNEVDKFDRLRYFLAIFFDKLFFPSKFKIVQIMRILVECQKAEDVSTALVRCRTAPPSCGVSSSHLSYFWLSDPRPFMHQSICLFHSQTRLVFNMLIRKFLASNEERCNERHSVQLLPPSQG
jgi:hypothetical protein